MELHQHNIIKSNKRWAMNENQFIRYGIPGWTFIIVIVNYWIISNGFTFNSILDKNYNFVGPVTFIIGAGLPIGFLIYQLYFQFDWLAHLILKISSKILTNIQTPDELFKDIKYWTYKTQKSIQIVEFMWNKKMYELGNESEFLNEKLKELLMLLHALGASGIAIVVGHFVSYMLFSIFLGYSKVNNPIAFLTVLIFWAFLLLAIIMNYRYVQYNIICFQNSIIRRVDPKLNTQDTQQTN